MDTTRRSSDRRLRNNGAAAAASIALAVFASAMGTLTAAASPGQASVTAGAVINTVRFFAGVKSPVSVGTLRIDELRQLTAARRGSGPEGERPDGPPALVLEWVELPTRGSDVGTADGWLSLRVINLSPLCPRRRGNGDRRCGQSQLAHAEQPRLLQPARRVRPGRGDQGGTRAGRELGLLGRHDRARARLSDGIQRSRPAAPPRSRRRPISIQPAARESASTAL